jgi:hypothetical protein
MILDMNFRNRRRYGRWSIQARDVKQPMVSVNFTNGVSCTVVEDIVEKFYFANPFPMRTDLTFWKHEGFAGIETTVYSR